MDIAPNLGENESVPRRLIVLTSLVLACGPDAADTEAATTAAKGSTATSDTSTSDTPTSDTPTSTAEATQAATTEVATTSTTGTVATDTATTEPAATSTGDTSTGTTSTTGDGTTDDSTTGEDDVQYAAFFFAGGLDHIMVHRADFTNDRCTTLHFAWPGGVDPAFKISAPNEWAVANADIAMGTADCLAGMPMGASESAIGGLGEATWQQGPNEYCPSMIDLDLVLDFPQGMPWVPAQEQMLVTALPVQNCP